MKYDLHVHTNKSDGELRPDDVIKMARSADIKVISITDHDTLKAYDSLDENALEDISLIRGIELSTLDYGFDIKCPVHILGYNIDIHNEDLNAALNKMEISRIKEIKAVIKKLGSEVDERISMPNVMRFSKKITMNSVADYMAQIGIVKSREDAYKDYLTDGQIAFVQKDCMTPEDAISIVKKAGGIPVLAHPNRLRIAHSDRLELIRRLVKCGLEAVEVYCIKMSDEEISEYTRICKELNIKISAGSDFHKTVDTMGEWRPGMSISTDLVGESDLLLKVL